MKKVIPAVLVVTLFTGPASYCQMSKKEVVQQYRQITKLKIAEVQEGRGLELARSLSLPDFIEYYIKNGKEVQSKKYGRLKIEDLFRDSSYTYFGRIVPFESAPYLIDLIKVANNELDLVNYANLNGSEIRREFINEIMPLAYNSLERPSEFCLDCFDYKFIPGTDQVLVKYKWSVTDDKRRATHKIYSAKYNIASMRFEK